MTTVVRTSHPNHIPGIDDRRSVAEMLAERPRLSPEGINQAMAALDMTELTQRLHAEAQLAQQAVTQLMAAEDNPAQMAALETVIRHTNAVEHILGEIEDWSRRAKHSWTNVGGNAGYIHRNCWWTNRLNESAPPDIH